MTLLVFLVVAVALTPLADLALRGVLWLWRNPRIWWPLGMLAFVLPAPAHAQDPTPTPAIKADILSTICTLTKVGSDKTPVVGIRATVEAPLKAGFRLALRADLSRLSDGGAVDIGTINVPEFQSAEAYVILHRPVVGPVGAELVYGRALALQPDQTLIEADPTIWGAGLRLELRGGFIFCGLGRHGAAGSGTRMLVSLLLPARGNTSFLVDGALGERGKNMIRSGIAVRF